MLERVTDPNILKQLSSQNTEQDYEKVSDPDLLSKLNNSYQIPNYPFVTRPLSPEETKQSSKDVREFLKGAAQSFINTPEEAANVFGKHLYNKFNFAPDTEASKIGGYGGDVASYFLPSGAITGTTKALSLIPKAKLAINALTNAVKSRPVINAISTLVKNVGEASLFQKEKFPQASNMDVLKAGSLGAAVPIAMGALTSSNPLVSTLAKLGIGGGLGYYYNGIPGAIEGATAGVTIPKMLKEIGIGNAPVSSEFLTQEQNPLAQSRYESGNRLGTPLRPSEAFNSSSIARQEGMIPRSEVGGHAMSELGQQRLIQQNKAINNLLNTIYPKTKNANNAIRNLYEESYKNDLSQNAMNDLFEDPVLTQAAKKVYEDPAYMKDLKDVRANSFAYLDQVKRALDDMQQTALKAGEKNKARIYGDSSKKLIDTMDNEAPEYKMARDAAQKKIIREQIEKGMKSRAMTGTNFFNTFLRNDEKFSSLNDSLKNVPEAQQQLKDMKLAWEHLIGTETPRAASGSSARSMSTARNEMAEMWNKYKDMFGAPRDIERANFIHDPKWWDKFEEVMQYKDKQKRIESLGNLISKGITTGTLESEKMKK